MTARPFQVGDRVQAVLTDEFGTELPDMVGNVIPIAEWPATMPDQWTEENTLIVRWDRATPSYSVYRPNVAARMLRVLDPEDEVSAPAALRPVVTGDMFREAPARDLRAGDGILHRYYDAAGMSVEEVVFANDVTTRRYGKGSRVIVKWAYGEERSYKPDHIFGVFDEAATRVQNERSEAAVRELRERLGTDGHEDDGTEAESLAEVSVPAFPDVLAHGRACVA